MASGPANPPGVWPQGVGGAIGLLVLWWMSGLKRGGGKRGKYSSYSPETREVVDVVPRLRGANGFMEIVRGEGGGEGGGVVYVRFGRGIRFLDFLEGWVVYEIGLLGLGYLVYEVFLELDFRF